jgi:hypothetical protein
MERSIKVNITEEFNEWMLQRKERTFVNLSGTVMMALRELRKIEDPHLQAMPVALWKNNKWASYFMADEHISDGMCTTFFLLGEIVAVVNNDCEWHVAIKMPGDPMVQRHGERKPVFKPAALEVS